MIEEEKLYFKIYVILFRMMGSIFINFWVILLVGYDIFFL